jgi:hypothetical protein
MKFHIQNMYIWLTNGRVRKLSFEPNKVNIITGDSLTGKTAILDIIDYCLFASKHTISEASINERAEWYGLRFFVEGKTYTIARKAPDGNTVSLDYFFSSVGDVPEGFPDVSTTENALKRMLSADFAIDQDAKVPYGGSMIQAGSRVSLRYFLLFNTISQDIITHTQEFFDKQSDRRYREALPRTFDLAVGIDTVSNILKREKRLELEKKLKRLMDQADRKAKRRELFSEELSEIALRAREFGLVDEEVDTHEAISELSELVSRQETGERDVTASRRGQLTTELSKCSIKIRNLKRFTQEYAKYKSSVKATDDSLKAVDFLSNNFEDLVRTSIFEGIIEALRSDHAEIKKAISANTPLDSNVSDLLKNLESERSRIRSELADLPGDIRSLATERDKFFFLGATKAKLDLYTDQGDVADDKSSQTIERLEEQIASLDVQSVDERRDLFVTVMNETTQGYLVASGDALGDYAKYRTFFDYKDKRLLLKKPMSLSTENVGSSSNHMFLHLFMFLGLHEVIRANKVDHVAPFLVIDQFSRPYWGERGNEKEELESTDVAKVKTALELLNSFIGRAIEAEGSFQMIVFEHIPESYWSGMENIHLVEKFENGNALIPDGYV